jgi:DNA (cytosine-5)-methyltransferase 1
MNQHFTFVDLFAGIGGFHLAMHRLGGECVFASEINKGNIVMKIQAIA